MLRRLPSLLVSACLMSGAASVSLWPRVAGAQAPAPAASTPPSQAEAHPTAPAPARVAVPPEAPARASPTRTSTSNRKAAPAEAPAPVAAPPAPPPVQPVEYMFLRREDPEVDLVQLQQLGAEGWQVVATVVVDGSTKRYVLMRPKR
ncbi:hypothetical protein JY651_47670 [Pyxidicoccus parkwayensis]|uniref:DUF4177 domain-containing protein n=1 Tax=Pyxidicoccus parkwayensis TaxID=2813578 RepID=A0ABX7NYZ4_9BACT|nr:hypothetical protein [Pyxidicoccus parkwaysis]QSQ22702.1 hypothetical protein JY651_47670 [Pyxidicoccus parkwaysis]